MPYGVWACVRGVKLGTVPCRFGGCCSARRYPQRQDLVDSIYGELRGKMPAGTTFDPAMACSASRRW
jgi:hypothetical protein